jgi:hypothetical protein
MESVPPRPKEISLLLRDLCVSVVIYDDLFTTAAQEDTETAQRKPRSGTFSQNASLRFHAPG